MKASGRIKSLAESQTIALAKKVRELKASGKDVIGLTVGEPDFDTPDHIRASAIEAIQEGFTHYTPVPGIPPLKQAIADKFKRENNLSYEASNILVSTGAKQSLFNVIMCLIDPGDEVIIPAPYWVSYIEIVKLAGGKPVIIDAGIDQDFKITPKDLEKAITSKTMMLLLNSPGNPTGMMYDADELAALSRVIEKHPEVVVVSDEIYEHISYGKKHVSIGTNSNIFDRTVTINGMSKGFAMTGWRIGYIGAPKWIVELCDKLQGQSTSGTNSIAQRASLTALSTDLYPTYAMRDQFRDRRDFMFQAFGKIPNVKTLLPDGAFYFFPDISTFFGKTTPDGKTIKDSAELTDYLLMEANVAGVPGSAFGAENHIRFSYAASLDTLKEAMHRITLHLDRLK